MILVTGGTGLIGSHLLYQLTCEFDSIIAVYRDDHKIEKVKKIFSSYQNDYNNLFSKIQWLKADITDVPSLETVFTNNFKYVFHCAALVSFDPKDYQEMRKVNIEGTANIVNFSIENNIKKLCLVSSIATIDNSIKDTIITEKNEWINSNDKHGYAITKYGSEMEVWRGSQEGLDVIIVNPGIVLGNGFFHEGSGKIFTQVYKGLKFYTEGITGFVGVKDVVEIMIQLMKSAIKNEHYILVSENKSFKELLHSIAYCFNIKKPSVKVNKTMTAILWRLDWIATKITGKNSFLTKHFSKSVHNKNFYSSNKIRKDLNFKFEKIEKVIQDICLNFPR